LIILRLNLKIIKIAIKIIEKVLTNRKKYDIINTEVEIVQQN